MTPESSRSNSEINLGHSVGAPYWTEYGELATEKGGIPHFRRSFAVKKYVLSGDELSAEEHDYINLLIQNAESHDKHACLGFVRSCMRSGAIRREFNGFHIALLRNPFKQFTSCKELNFMDAITNVSEVIMHFFERIGKWYEQQCRVLNPIHHGSLHFAICYLLSNVTAMIHSDLVIDTDRLAIEASYRSDIIDQIRKVTGLSPDFSDCVQAGRTNEALKDDYVALNDAMKSLTKLLFANQTPGLVKYWSALPQVISPKDALLWIDVKRTETHSSL
jgi:hypothetical protein